MKSFFHLHNTRTDNVVAPIAIVEQQIQYYHSTLHEGCCLINKWYHFLKLRTTEDLKPTLYPRFGAYWQKQMCPIDPDLYNGEQPRDVLHIFFCQDQPHVRINNQYEVYTNRSFP